MPNMDIATKNGQSTPIISMRGMRSTNETELGDPSVGVHLDGIYSPRMQGILALMFDNERVEVLRGPQGTLFGRNSTVGSINIVTAKPKLDLPSNRASTCSYGNYNAPEVQGIVNKPVTDTFAVRFAGRYHQRDSYRRLLGPEPVRPAFYRGQGGGRPVIAPGSFEDCTSPECVTREPSKFNWWVDDRPATSIRALVPADDDDFYMNSKEWAYRVSALWQPKDKDMSLNLSFQHYRSDSAGGVDLVNCEKLRGVRSTTTRRGKRDLSSTQWQSPSSGHERLLRHLPERRHLPGRGQRARQALPRHHVSAFPVHLGYQRSNCVRLPRRPRRSGP